MAEKNYKINEIFIANILFNICIMNDNDKLEICSKLFRQIYHIVPGKMEDIFQDKYIKTIPIVYAKIDNTRIDFVPISYYLSEEAKRFNYISQKKLEKIYIELNINEIKKQNNQPVISINLQEQAKHKGKIINLNEYRKAQKRKKDLE